MKHEAKIAPSGITVSMKEAKNRLTELARRVEEGETVTITRNGKPVLDMAPHKKTGGINWEALEAYKREHGITRFFDEIPEDFNSPCSE